MQYINYVLPEPKKLFNVPLSVAMLVNAQRVDNDYFIDTYSVKSVSLAPLHAIIVGRIVSIELFDERVLLYINDNTGTIKAISFLSTPLTEKNSYVKIAGLTIFNKTKPELSLEQIAPITDSNEITNHWLKVIMCRLVRRNEPFTEAELQAKPTFVSSPTFDTLNTKERIVLEAAKDLQKHGEGLSQEKLYDKVCEKIADYTEFTATMDELSSKGYLHVISK